MLRIFFFLFGFGLMVIGFTYIILYLNLFSVGYNFSEYVNFILSNTFCENERDLVNIAISLGLNARKMTKNDK